MSRWQGVQRGVISRKAAVHCTVVDHATLPQHDAASAKPLQKCRIVASENEDAGSRDELLQNLVGALHEGSIPHSDSFVYQQDVRMNHGGDAEDETRLHAVGVDAERQMQELAEIRQRRNFVNARVDLRAR